MSESRNASHYEAKCEALAVQLADEKALRERAEDRVKAAGLLLDRVKVQDTGGEWDEPTALLDWCCDYKDWKNGHDSAWQERSHENCGHRGGPQPEPLSQTESTRLDATLALIQDDPEAEITITARTLCAFVEAQSCQMDLLQDRHAAGVAVVNSYKQRAEALEAELEDVKLQRDCGVSEYAQLEQRAEAALGLLREVVWQRPSKFFAARCVVCDAPQAKGHAKTCKVGQALATEASDD